MQFSNYDSISNQLRIPLRNTSHQSLESVPSESNTEPDDPQLASRKLTNSTMDSLSDQLNIEGESCICDSRKASNSTLDSVSCQIEPVIENSMHLRRVSDSASDSVSEQLNMEIRDDSSSSVNSLDQLKDEAGNFYCNLSKVSNTTRDSVLGHHRIESENPQSNLSIISNPAAISVLDQTEVNVESPNCQLEKDLNVVSGSISVPIEAEKSTHSLVKTLTSDMGCVLNHPEVEAENSKCTLNSVVDSVSVQPGNSSNTNLDSFSDQLQPQVEAENGNYILEDENCKIEKASNVAFNSTSLQVEAEKPTDSFRTLTLDMDCVSNQPKVEAESNKGTLSSVMDSVPVQPVTVSSSNLGSPSVQLQPRVEAANGDCRLDKLSNTAFDAIPSVQGTSPIHQSTSSSPASNKPENASAQQGVISSGDSIRTNHKRRLESPIKSSLENSAVSRRRSSSGSRKAGHSENDSQGSPSLPNYMAATASAKAKSRAVNSQDSSPDVQEYGTAKRRNSFPASNGNQHTGSPQAHRSSPQVQRTTKGNGVHSPRDSTEKLKQEWRR